MDQAPLPHPNRATASMNGASPIPPRRPEREAEDLDRERALVGVMVRNGRPEVLTEALELVPDDHVADPWCRFVFGVIRSMVDNGRPTMDAISVSRYVTAHGPEAFTAHPPIFRPGLGSWLDDVTGDSDSVAPAAVHFAAKDVLAAGQLRHIREAAVKINQLANNPAIHDMDITAEIARQRGIVADILAARQEGRAATTATPPDPKLVAGHVTDMRARQAAKETMAVAEFVTPDPPRTLAAIKAAPKHRPGWRIRGLVQLRAFVTIVGARKVGKTSFIGSLLLAVLDGYGPALGRVEWEVLEQLPGKVLILSYEMGEEWQDWLDAAGVTDEYGDRVLIWDLLGTANPLSSGAGRAEFQQHLDGVSLVIVDTFAQAYSAGLAGGGGVNEDVNAWLNMVRGIIGPDRALWLSVHAGWDGSRSRGASAIEDQPTSIITLESAADGTRFLSTRGRRVEEVRRIPLRLDPTTLRVTVNERGPAWSVANGKDEAADDDARHASTAARKRERAIAGKESDQWAALRFLAGLSKPVGRRAVTAATPLSEGAARVALEALGLRGCAVDLPKRAGWQITAAGIAAVSAAELPEIGGA